MAIYQSAVESLREKITALAVAVRQTSLKTKVLFGSAFTLAFLIAPAAALMLSGNPSSIKSADDNSISDPGNASTTNSQSSAQASADAAAGVSSSDGNSSMSVSVNNESTTVSVNGQTVQAPATPSGSVSKSLNNNGTTTTVNIQNSTSSSGSNHTFTNKSVHINSHSNVKTESGQ